jgi:uncharacterized protein YndB with AHSA1/START domain
MRRILGGILALLAVAVLGILGLAALKPDTMRIERQATIRAPAEAIFPLLTDFRAWAGWSPWEDKDPAMKRHFSGPASGPGAAYAWEGNDDVGVGRMEITEAVAPSRVVLRLDFTRPFEAHNQVVFTLSPSGSASGGGTTVSWVMTGPNPLMARIVQVFMDMDAMVGADFERGLAGMRRLTEK